MGTKLQIKRSLHYQNKSSLNHSADVNMAPEVQRTLHQGQPGVILEVDSFNLQQTPSLQEQCEEGEATDGEEPNYRSIKHNLG